MSKAFVTSSDLLWETFQLTKHYRCRASELLHVEDPWTAYQIDRAVYAFGSALSAELEGVEGKDKSEIERKRLRVITKWLPKAVDASGASSQGRFADPASRSI
jgi:hypothetical protein